MYLTTVTLSSLPFNILKYSQDRYWYLIFRCKTSKLYFVNMVKRQMTRADRTSCFSQISSIDTCQVLI